MSFKRTHIVRLIDNKEQSAKFILDLLAKIVEKEPDAYISFSSDTNNQTIDVYKLTLNQPNYDTTS